MGSEIAAELDASLASRKWSAPRSSLVSKDPPGSLLRYDGLPLAALDETKAAYWTLDTLAEAAQEMGIEVRASRSDAAR